MYCLGPIGVLLIIDIAAVGIVFVGFFIIIVVFSLFCFVFRKSKAEHN